MLGAAFQPLVSLAVAVILYDAGMALDLRQLHGHTRRIVVRLIVMGVPVTLAFGAVFASLLLGLSWQAAVMTGTILVVSGPTVVGPLLGFVRPAERVQRVLSWEGSLIDPVGGILGAVVFHAVVASTHRVPGYQLGQFLLDISVGLAGGLVGVALLWLLLHKLRLGEVPAPAPSSRRWWPWPPDATSSARTPGSSRPSSWAWPSPTCAGSTSRPGGRSSRPWCS
jgi:NhaP-type Na+/H+ or K+/H+ antiporter